MLRGCGSSVYSIESGQSLSRQYCTCAVMSSSVKSGRYEKVPWVILIAFLFFPTLIQNVGVTTASGTSIDVKSNEMSFHVSSALASAGDQRAARARISGPSL